jgi:hypothetical protein
VLETAAPRRSRADTVRVAHPTRCVLAHFLVPDRLVLSTPLHTPDWYLSWSRVGTLPLQTPSEMCYSSSEEAVWVAVEWLRRCKPTSRGVHDHLYPG